MRGAQLPKPCFLISRRFERRPKAILCVAQIGRICGQDNLAFYPLGFSCPPPFTGSFNLLDCLICEIDCLPIAAGAGIGVRKAGQVE